MKILITADMVPTESNEDLFLRGDLINLVGAELSDLFIEADFRVVNLEMPFYDGYTPIDKSGPCLCAKTNCIEAYSKLNINLVTLANNHIMDQGEEGCNSIIEQLTLRGISFIGVGRSRKEASEPYYLTIDGKTVAFYAIAEHEFSILDETNGGIGANPYTPLVEAETIRSIREKCDFLVILYHGGKEHYRYPSPQLRERCRMMAESGADLILCQHSHCIGCFEDYKGCTIIFGQGNFIFDEDDLDCWNTGLIVQISDGFKVEVIPVVRESNGVRLASGSTKESILSDYYRRSMEIKEDTFLRSAYTELAKESISYYLLTISGVRRKLWFRALNKISKQKFQKIYISRHFRKNRILAILNSIECEAHSELFIAGLKEMVK